MQNTHTLTARLVAALLLVTTVCSTGTADDAAHRAEWNSQHQTPPSDLAAYFQPTLKYWGDLGKFPSPLVFDDGAKVETADQWAKRRAEIAAKWHGAMGKWPPLIESPRVDVVQTTKRENVTQHQVKVEIGVGRQMVDGFLLVPDGEGPFAAVVVPYYDAQTGAGLGTELRDFGWQLAKRGFVTLSIGKPNSGINLNDSREAGRRGRYYGDTSGPIELQPLSALAYAAANAHTVLASRDDVLPERIGIVGHSFGGKWAMFASCLYDKFACAAWSDPGIVFDERDRRKENPGGSVNYWDRWYLGFELGSTVDGSTSSKFRALPSDSQPRTGSYKKLIGSGSDLTELHALMAPRPFLVSGGTADMPERWPALNHAIAVNSVLGLDLRVMMTNRDSHAPTKESNETIYRFCEWWLQEKILDPSE